MNSVVFLQVIVVSIVLCQHHVYGEFEEGHFDQIWSKKSLCNRTDMVSPPSILNYLPRPRKYLKVVCLYNSQYYYTEKYTPDMLDPDLCTHLNYEFAYLDDRTYQLIAGDPKLDLQKKFYEKATDLKTFHRNLKVFLSLGGWADSTEKYSELVRTPARRANFIKNSIDFLKRHNFDGLDVAWEYPNAWQGDIGKYKDDKPNFTLFLKELKQAFDQVHLGISASVAANYNEINAAYEVSEISKLVSHLNIMTYDLHGHWEGKTGHHAQFDSIPSSSSSYMINSLNEWVKRGADKKKLVVGVPAYGRTCTLKDAKNHGYGAPIIGPGDPGPITEDVGYMAFNEICHKLERENWTVVEDAKAGSYAYKGDQWIGFDSMDSLARKVKYVVKNGFGGVALKDITGDDFNGCCFNKYKFPLLLTVTEKILESVFSPDRNF